MNFVGFILIASFWQKIVADEEYNDCVFAKSHDQKRHCLIRHSHKEKIFKELTALGGQRVDPNIKDTSAYLAALKRHRKQSVKQDEPCSFPTCDPDGIVKRIALRMKQAPQDLPDDSNRIWFNISTLTPYNFEEAVVLYYVGRIKDLYPNRAYKARFYNYISTSDVSEYTVLKMARDLDNTTGLMSVDDNWESFDITALVRNWIDEPENNYGIMIKLTVEDEDGEEEYGEVVATTKPPAYLEISNTRFRFKEKRNSAIQPRKTPMCEQGQNHNSTSCCLFPFSLSFEDFNWDWIIAPKRIDFFYCAGYCNAASLKQVSHSAILYSKKPIEMCCAPETADPVDILYQDSDGNLQLKSIKNMIVRSCSCS